MANVRHWIARSVVRLSLLALVTVAALAMLAQPASAAVVYHATPATHIGAQALRTDRYGDKIYTVSTATGSATLIIGRPTSPALIPYSASGCVGNLPWNNVQTCFTIIGGGRYVNEMYVSAYIRNSVTTLALQMKGPNGFADYSAFVTLNRGVTAYLVAQLNRDMPTGKYCGQSIVISGGGSGTACESVTA